MVLALGLLLLTAGGAAGQSWSTVHSSRQVGSEDVLDVQVRYGSGQFQMTGADTGILYQMELEYDEESFRPISEYRNGSLSIGVEGTGSRMRFGRNESRGSMNLRVSRDVPVGLRMEFGAVRATMDLGGLQLHSLDLSTGASDADLRVSAPNPIRLSSARMKVGAASFEAREMANLNAERLEIDAGVGSLHLDFSGTWSGNTRAEVKIGMGSLEISVPETVGIRLSRSTFLTSIDAPGLERRGDELLSPNWEEAEHRLDLHVSAALGSVRIMRVP